MNCRSTSVLALLVVLATACNTKKNGESKAPAGETAQAAQAEGNAEKGDEDAGAEGAGAKKAAAPTPDPVETPATPATAVDSAALADPSKATATAPAEFVVELTTSKGPIRFDVKREWAPKGADRFYNLVKAGYYTDVAFFRVIPGFMAQVGLHGDPTINRTWRSANIDDDPVTQSNTRGMVTFATAGPNTRTTQFFINFANNTRLDGMGFSPFARVQEASMSVVDSLHGGYGEGAPRGKGPSQARIHAEGNRYLKAEFSELDYIQKATVLEK